MKTEQQESTAVSSRRTFLKGAVTVAYVAPLVVSMPAKATKAGYGSAKTDKEDKDDKKHDKDMKAGKKEVGGYGKGDKGDKKEGGNKYSKSAPKAPQQVSTGPSGYKFQGYKSQSKK